MLWNSPPDRTRAIEVSARHTSHSDKKEALQAYQKAIDLIRIIGSIIVRSAKPTRSGRI